MTEANQKRLEVVEWESTNRNSTNRAINPSESCYYSHSFNGGCAVGRLLPEDIAEKADLDNALATSSGIREPEIWEICSQVELVTLLGMDFLADLQFIHDNGYHWTKKGLSEIGMRERDRVVVKIKSRKYN